MEVNKTEQVPLLFHPSVFSALGEDMVTSDTVAIAELVKNSYDAFAFNVLIKFEKDEKGQNQIVVEDDGFGMTKDIIQNAWATVATPYKRKNPVAKRIINGKEEIRVVSGNKGLGRCSAARLGDEMKMITKHKNGECIQAIFDWTALNNIESVSDALMTLEYLNGNKFINNESKTGTIIEIKNLKSSWNESKITLLKNELSRLITPFEEVRNFSIKILFSDTNAPVDVQPLDFISEVKSLQIATFPDDYIIIGKIIGDGEVLCISKKDQQFIRLFEGEERRYINLKEFFKRPIKKIRINAEEIIGAF